MPLSIGVTAASSAVILAIYAATQVMTARAFIVLVPGTMEPLSETNAFVRSLESSGFILSLSIITSAFVGTGCVFFVSQFSKGMTSREYLGFHFVPFRVLLWWIGITLLFLLLSDGLTVLLGRAIVPDFAADVYRTATVLPLLWFAFTVAAPVFEEIFFRGFIFEGIRRTRLGPSWAILLTSLFWTLIHLQYDLFEMGIVFVAGTLLGMARLWTRSLYTTIGMHFFANLVSLTETALYLSFSQQGT